MSEGGTADRTEVVDAASEPESTQSYPSLAHQDASDHDIPVNESASEERSKDNIISRLMEEISELRRHSSGALQQSGSESMEGLKKQYDSKLKDVMEKARDHAKKIATERDELRRVNDEKDAKLLQQKQLIAAANVELEENEGRVRELDRSLVIEKQAVEKLQQQMHSMENHYTKPPLGQLEASLSVLDTSGTEWLLVEDRWWKRSALLNSIVSVKASLSSKELGSLQNQISQLNGALGKSRRDLDQYKKKVDQVLREKSGTPAPVDSDSGLETTKRVMKLEEELNHHISTISSLKKQIVVLQGHEKNLLAQLASVNAENSRLGEPADKMEARLSSLQSENRMLTDKLIVARATIAELTRDLEESRSVVAVQPNAPLVTEVADSQAHEAEPDSQIQLISISTQTDLLPAILRSDPSVSVSANARASPSQAPTRPDSVNAQHDAVAIPLRQQIRDLILELESEKHEHGMTISQLSVVKEELRKVEAEKKLGSDLTDPVKVEYMRNVARRFIAIAPQNSSDEFEQLIPVILNFFGLEGDEAISLMKDRRRRISGSTSSSNFPKLW